MMEWKGESERMDLRLGVACFWIDASQLPRKYKVWCYRFTLYRRVMWPLKLCELTSSAVARTEARANAFILKWLVLPR